MTAPSSSTDLEAPHQVIETDRGEWTIAVARHRDAPTFTFDISAPPSHFGEPRETYERGLIVNVCHNMTRAQLEEHVARCQAALAS